MSDLTPCRYEHPCEHLFCSLECASSHPWDHEAEPEQEAESEMQQDDAEMPQEPVQEVEYHPAEAEVDESPGYLVSSWHRLFEFYRSFLLPKKVDPTVLKNLFASDHRLSASCIHMTCDGTELTFPWRPVSGMKIEVSHDDRSKLETIFFYIKRCYRAESSRIMMLPPIVNPHALRGLVAKDIETQVEFVQLLLGGTPLPMPWEVDDNAVDIELVILGQ